MTAVGKLLVFLNLVFSLVVGTFAVFDYTARTHWADAYKKVEASNAVLQGTVAAYKTEAERLSKEKADLNDTLVAAAGKDLELKGDGAAVARLAARRLTENKTKLENLAGQLLVLQKQLQDERTKATDSKTTSTVGIETTKRALQDVENLRDSLRSEQEKVTKSIVAMNDMRDKKVAAEIAMESFRDRNVVIEKQLRELNSEVARLRANALVSSAPGGSKGRPGSGSLGGASPPPTNAEGLVARAEGNLVKITIGSDSGLSKGNTLEVFRLGQTPKYLGRIRIVEVTPNEAVGQAMGRLSAPILKGDRVASTIMGGN